MEIVFGLLPIVALLACPLMMVVCLVGLGRRGGAATPDEAARTPEERVFVLQRQLQTIQDELAMLQAAEAGNSRDDASTDGDRAAGVNSGVPHAIQRRA